MVPKCDKVSKEENLKYVVENRNYNKEVEGSISLEIVNAKLKKSVIEVMNGIDSDDNSLECSQHKCGENW